MKINKEFTIRNIAGDYVMVPLGNTSNEFCAMISTNEVGVFMWNLLREGISLEELFQKVLDTFDVEETVARQDVNEFVEQLKKLDLLEM